MRHLSKSDRQREEVTVHTDLRFWLVCYVSKKKEEERVKIKNNVRLKKTYTAKETVRQKRRCDM